MMSEVKTSNKTFKAHDYTHLDDTNYPRVEEVDVYKYENNFDYKRWKNNVNVTLCNVKWQSDYQNVVKFENDSARDQYFDTLSDAKKVQLKTMFSFFAVGNIKVPLPHNSAMMYNYLFVDIPIQTTPSDPIEYAFSDRVRRVYYFIQNAEQLAPNTTQLYLTVDVWTTFFNSIEVHNAHLIRGHAPLKKCATPSEYLKNPLANNNYLLTPDVAYGCDIQQTKKMEYIPVGASEKYIVLVLNCEVSDLVGEGDGVYAPNDPSVDFAPKNNIYGMPANWNDIKDDRLNIIGYGWNFSNYTFDGVEVRNNKLVSTDNTTPNNTKVCAMSWNTAIDFFNQAHTHAPHIYKNIIAMLQVEKNMLNLGSSYEVFSGCLVYEIDRTNNIEQAFDLKVSDFGYDDKYKNLTKLYTDPYAEIEITDNNGEIKKVKIENTAGIKAIKSLQLAMPFLNYQVLFTGIGAQSDVSTEYTWKKLSGGDTKKMFGDDFAQYIFDFEIPTFALYQSEYSAYIEEQYPSLIPQRNQAEDAYWKAKRTQNIGKYNTYNTAKTTKDCGQKDANTAKLDAYDTASANKANTETIADYNRENAFASAETTRANEHNNADNNYTVALRANQIAFDIDSLNNEMWLQGKEKNVWLTDNIANNYQSPMNRASWTYDAASASTVATIENQTAYLTAAVNTVANMDPMSSPWFTSTLGAWGETNAAKNRTATFLQGGGNGATFNFDSTYSGYTALLATTKNTEVTDTVNDYAYQKMEAQNLNSEQIVSVTNQADKDIYNNQYSINKDTLKLQKEGNDLSADTIKNVRRTDASNNESAQKANANRSRQADYDTAKKSYDTATGIANRDYDNKYHEIDDTTGYGTLQKQYNNTTLCEDESFEGDFQNDKINLIQAQYMREMDFKMQKMKSPRKIGLEQGDSSQDVLERRGVSIKIRTQNEDVIAQNGDYFLRYGYASDHNWNVDEWQVMEHFTYWKFSEVWLTAEGLAIHFQDEIKRILTDGTTVWTHPNEVGSVSIYDN